MRIVLALNDNPHSRPSRRPYQRAAPLSRERLCNDALAPDPTPSISSSDANCNENEGCAQACKPYEADGGSRAGLRVCFGQNVRGADIQEEPREEPQIEHQDERGGLKDQSGNRTKNGSECIQQQHHR